MINIKEATDKIYQALYGEEVRSAIVEAFTVVDGEFISIDGKFTSKIAEQNATLEKEKQITDKKILQLRISILVLFSLLINDLCCQITVKKQTDARFNEYVQIIKKNTQIIEEGNSLIIEYLDEVKRKEA